MKSATVFADMARKPAALRPLIAGLEEVGIELSRTIRRGAFGGDLGDGVGENLGGDQQKALDRMADEAFAARLMTADVRHYASEERDYVDTLDENGHFAMAIDPLGGSSNIDVNVPIGTI